MSQVMIVFRINSEEITNKFDVFVISNQILIAHPFKISYYEIAKYLLVRDFADYAHKITPISFGIDVIFVSSSKWCSDSIVKDALEFRNVRQTTVVLWYA